MEEDIPTLSISRAASLEGDYLTFTLRLSEAPTDAVTVDFASLGGTVLVESDLYRSYGDAATTGTVTFAAGETVRTLRVLTVNDNLDELDESFFLELRNPVGVTFGANVHSLAATGWVLDGDGVSANRAISVSNPVVTEAGGGQALFTVSLSEAFSSDRTFSFSTFNGSALSGSDYVARTGSVTFLAGQTEATVAVSLANDTLAEGGESFGLSITGAHGLTGATGTAKVLDGDGSVPVLSIEGDRAAEGDYLTFTLRLSEAATDAVTVDFASLGGTVLVESDLYRSYGDAATTGTVTFAAGETVRTLRVLTVNDNLDELDESFFLELRNPVGVTFGANVHSLAATGWVLDGDGVSANRAISVSNPVVTEAGGGQALFTVSLSEAFSSDRTFSFSTFNGSALSGSDYVARTGSVTFLAGQTEATVAVSLANDSLAEGGESFGLSITGAHGLTGATGTAKILDGDGSVPVLSIEGDRAVEGDYLTFTLRLSEAASDAVTVDFASLGGTVLVESDLYRSYGDAATTGTVTFAAGETVRTLRVLTVNDNLDELDESFFLELRNPVGVTFGAGNTSLSTIGWVLDGDGVSLNRSVAVSGAEVREGPDGRAAVFLVELSTPVSTPISLSYSTVSGSAVAGSDFTAASGTVTFRAGQTHAEIRIPIRDDLTLEGPESFSLRVAPPFPSQISAGNQAAFATATILDGTLRGTSAGDILQGTERAERIEGFAGNDRISGLGGNDILSGSAGNDTLTGGTGNDTLLGGADNDVYVADGSDTIIEAANAGTDLVQTSVSLTLAANLENLVLTGSAAVNATGNAGANRITGNGAANVLNGGSGNDTLDGGAGNDTLLGGYGDDTFIFASGDTISEASGAGTDTVQSFVSLTLGTNLENLTLVGSAAVNGFGNGLANRIIGNAAANTLNGGAGKDTLAGGFGNDIYILSDADTISEAAGAGIDRVQSSVSLTLASNVENLTLTGAAALTGTGNSLANFLSGNGGNNRLDGGLGNDTLSGGSGKDTLLGNVGKDRLSGGSGADRLEGGQGKDWLTGGTGADSFVFSTKLDTGASAKTRDVITDFKRGQGDHIDLKSIDANAKKGGNQAFSFIGDDDFSGAAGELRSDQVKNTTIVFADLNGDRKADFTLQLAGQINLSAQDFFL